MRALIDTCVLSEMQRPQVSPQVRRRLEAIALDDMYISVLSLGEIRKGIDKLKASVRKTGLDTWFNQVVLSSQGRILPIDHDTAMIWGEITARAEKKGRSIPTIDGLIAATALRHGLHLMTRNVTDFEATGVLLVNPWE